MHGARLINLYNLDDAIDQISGAVAFRARGNGSIVSMENAIVNVSI